MVQLPDEALKPPGDQPLYFVPIFVRRELRVDASGPRSDYRPFLFLILRRYELLSEAFEPRSGSPQRLSPIPIITHGVSPFAC